MSLLKKATELILALCFLGSVGCQRDEPKAFEPSPPSVEKPKQDFGEFQPLKAELLVRERSRSLIKFVRFKDTYMVFSGDDVDLSLSLFLKDTGGAYLYLFWVYPEYMPGGAKILRTSRSIIETSWEINGANELVVGEERLVITMTDIEGVYSGRLQPGKLNPPSMPGEQMLPKMRINEEAWPVRFNIVSESLEAEVVDAVF